MIGAVVLAAGLGRRFGGTKVLELLDGAPLVRHVVDRILEAGITDIVVVTGAAHDDVATALRTSSVGLARNPSPEGGLSSSLRAGIAALPADCEAFVVALGDQPRVAASTIRALVAAWRAANAGAAVPRYRDSDWGHPILIDATLRGRLSTLDGDAGARIVLQSLGERLVRVTVDTDAPVDVDTRVDLERLRAE